MALVRDLCGDSEVCSHGLCSLLSSPLSAAGMRIVEVSSTSQRLRLRECYTPGSMKLRVLKRDSIAIRVDVVSVAAVPMYVFTVFGGCSDCGPGKRPLLGGG